MVAPTVAPLLAYVGVATTAGTDASAQRWPFEVTDLAERESLTILVFGDAGTGAAG